LRQKQVAEEGVHLMISQEAKVVGKGPTRDSLKEHMQPSHLLLALSFMLRASEPTRNMMLLFFLPVYARVQYLQYCLLTNGHQYLKFSPSEIPSCSIKREVSKYSLLKNQTPGEHNGIDTFLPAVVH
jgi:hypothetical protein